MKPPQTANLPLFAFILLTLGGGWCIGFASRPDAWYAVLAKPAYMPPGAVFAPVWTFLYVLIAIAGWRIFGRERRGAAMRLWVLQLCLNYLWSPMFFSLHAIDGALAVIALLWLAIAAFMARAWSLDRAASLLFAPYLAWVSFAATLNVAILRLN